MMVKFQPADTEFHPDSDEFHVDDDEFHPPGEEFPEREHTFNSTKSVITFVQKVMSYTVLPPVKVLQFALTSRRENLKSSFSDSFPYPLSVGWQGSTRRSGKSMETR